MLIKSLLILAFVRTSSKLLNKLCEKNCSICIHTLRRIWFYPQWKVIFILLSIKHYWRFFFSFRTVSEVIVHFSKQSTLDIEKGTFLSRCYFSLICVKASLRSRRYVSGFLSPCNSQTVIRTPGQNRRRDGLAIDKNHSLQRQNMPLSLSTINASIHTRAETFVKKELSHRWHKKKKSHFIHRFKGSKESWFVFINKYVLNG